MDRAQSAGSVVRLRPPVWAGRRSTDFKVPTPREAAPRVGVERRLVQRAVAGDETAWATLVDAHVAEVWRYALRTCGDPIEAERICAVVWLRLAQELDGLATEQVAFWLRRCVDREAFRAAAARSVPPAQD